jgi:phosphate uptake regulator
MLIDLIKIWSEQSFSSQVIGEFISMLDSSEEMLSYVFKVLLGKTDPDAYQDQVYIKDQSINLRERDIRKRILIHLSTKPDCNLSACLALISVSKDAERLGDYVKNLFELRKLLKGTQCNHELFRILFDETGKRVLGFFREASEAFKNSDRERAAEVVDCGHEIAMRCEEIIEQVADSDFPADQAVVLALGARYLKRIALHLSNIASSVINPMPELGYFTPEQKK